jgi:hypothetical protein
MFASILSDSGLSPTTDVLRMTIPFYGQVWRQSSSPTLWLEGLHEPHQLVTHTLECDDAPVNNAPDLDLTQQDIALPIVDIVAEEGDEREKSWVTGKSILKKRIGTMPSEICPSM